MAIIGRIIVILFALIVASLAAGATVTAAVLLPSWSDLGLPPPDGSTAGVVVAFGAIFFSGFALLPALIMVLVSEIFGIRSALFYAAAGALAGFAIYWSFGGLDVGALTVNSFTRREAEIMAGAGIVAGWVYWLIAGRKAGHGPRPASWPQPGD